MYTITLNIGLNNNPYSADQILTMINDAPGHLFSIMTAKVKTGEYNGNEEPTLVLLLETNISWNAVINNVRGFCHAFTQECIPVKSEGLEELIYDPNFTGERYEFNEQYFITL